MGPTGQDVHLNLSRNVREVSGIAKADTEIRCAVHDFARRSEYKSAGVTVKSSDPLRRLREARLDQSAHKMPWLGRCHCWACGGYQSCFMPSVRCTVCGR
mmetsp:Transcript_22860/g.54110  ORF Transcript_22860/g.54110 Transcript_22860/m.54110 type:complete len:100 (+) Transcript_22860:780-1079(+)